jgi:hypothetical protein
MNPPNQALTVVAPLDRDPVRLQALRDLLAGVQKELRRQPAPFDPGRLPDTHFTRFIVLEDHELDPVLVWESNHDGKPLDYLRRAALAQPAGLDAIFAFCPGAPRAADPDAFARWAERHSLPYAAFHCAYRGTPKREVDAAIAAHRAIRAYLDEHRARLLRASPVEIEREIRAHLRALPDLDLTDYHKPVRDWLDRAWARLKLVKVLRHAPRGLRWYRQIPHAQAGEPVDEFDHPPHGKQEAIVQEDHIRQNQLTHVVDVKPGWFRRMNLDLVMQVIESEARAKYVHGELGGISSIHFARWVLVKDPRPGQHRDTRRDRLLFMSNYDFSWDSYLGEFIDRASKGLTAVWSNTEGFPRTKGLYDEGSRDEERFKQWTRNRQIPTDLWWSGVPESTVENVRNDVWIRRKLMRPMTDEELREWLTRL